MKPQDVPQQASSSGSQTLSVQETVEKRRHARVPVSIDVEVVDPQTGLRITGRATDLGVGGCNVDTTDAFPQECPVDVYLSWQEQKLHLRALVSYVIAGHSMGLAFTGTSAEAGSTLLDWLTGLGNEALEPEATREAVPETQDETQPCRLEEVVAHLVDLLARKQLLTEQEGAELRLKLQNALPR